MLRIILIFSFISTLCFSGFAQDKTEIDTRIIENIGESETFKAYLNRRDYYEFLVFEQNNTCKIINKSELPEGNSISDYTISTTYSVEEIQAKINNNTLNIEHLNLPNHDFNSLYIKLNETKVLFIQSKMKVKEAFMLTGKQNSK